MVFCIQSSASLIRITSLYVSHTSPVVLCMQNSVIRTRITSFYGSQTSPVVLCMQNNVIIIRISSLYGSQPSSKFLQTKQRLFDQNYKTLWVPDLICGYCKENSDFRTRITSLSGSQVFGIQNSDFGTRIASLYGSHPSFLVLTFKTATLAPELQVSKGPSPHLWFLHAKQRLLDQNYKSLWVPDLTYGFLHSKQHLFSQNY